MRRTGCGKPPSALSLKQAAGDIPANRSAFVDFLVSPLSRPRIAALALQRPMNCAVMEIEGYGAFSFMIHQQYVMVIVGDLQIPIQPSDSPASPGTPKSA